MSKPIEEREEAGGARGPARSPFIHSICVRWADCDPAAIAYTARIPAWALEAIEAWWERHAGLDWFQLNIDRKIGTPFVHMNLDFRSPITPRHKLDCEVALKQLGNRSIAHRVRGKQDGVLCFEGEFVAVFVEADTMKPRIPPPDILHSIRSLGHGA